MIMSPVPAVYAGSAEERHQVFLDVSVCPTALRADRALGDKSALCSDPRHVGRITIELFHDTAPSTCEIFEQLIEKGAYTGTTFDKIFKGKYIKAGQVGSKRYGEVDASVVGQIPPNPDLVSSKAYERRHLRPGTLSWCVPELAGDGQFGSQRNVEATEFLITTGPGPVPELDSINIVFGQVVSGMDALSELARVPTIRPNDTLSTYNAFAKFLGDDRADKARSRWGKPLQAVLITDAGFA